jgi:hypothetical protein
MQGDPDAGCLLFCCAIKMIAGEIAKFECGVEVGRTCLVPEPMVSGI